MRSLEGKNIPPYGFVVCVSEIVERHKGRVQDGSGYLLIPVKVKAVVLNVIRGHVIDGVVSSVNAIGFFVVCGPLKIFIPKNNLPDGYVFNDTEWRNESESIKNNSIVRVRVLGTKVSPTGVTAVGLISQDYLGLISQ